MAITLDPATKIFTVSQADLVFVQGTFYKADTNAIKYEIEQLMDNEQYIWMERAINHNTVVTIAGVPYARTLELINGYSIVFTPDAQWSVRLDGSNNNFFDIEEGILNQNQVQVIPTNSAGLQDSGQDIPTLIAALEAKVDTVQAKTDDLTFTKPGEVDVNIKSQNSATLHGTGVPDDIWRGTP